MLTRRCRTNFKTIRNCMCAVRRDNYSEKKKADGEAPVQSKDINLTLGEIGAKYQIFRDTDSKVILDVDEERLGHPDREDEPYLDPFSGINLQRGVNGVFEIEDLVNVLRRENAESVFVAAVPADIKYVDYICVVSGKSYRHMLAIAQFVKRVFKQKRHSYDTVPKVEGESSKEWIALDLGNIALHVFSREARMKYDLDTLWSVGPKYDPECNRQDPVAQMLERHSIYLKGFQPAS